MILEDKPRAHALRVINWLSESVFSKYSAGQKAHGGYLPEKGGVLHELECEIFDQAVYTHALREQLAHVLDLLVEGRVEDAIVTVNLILHGTSADRLPGSAPNLDDPLLDKRLRPVG